MSKKTIDEEHAAYTLKFTVSEASQSKLVDCCVEVYLQGKVIYRLASYSESSPDHAVDRLRRHALRWLNAENTIMVSVKGKDGR